MNLIHINLPGEYSLNINLSKRRKNQKSEPLFPNLEKVMRARKGNKFSRYFRLLFENERIKKYFGANLVLLVIASYILPTTVSGSGNEDLNSISSPIVLSTQQGVQFPVKNVIITQEFNFFHPGIDLDGTTGDVVYPLMAGKVKQIEYSRFGYGKSIIISHGTNTQSLYAHLSKIEVSKNQEVTKNTKIGEIGATGRAFGDHLHLEIYEDGRAINPLTILPQN